MDQIFDVEKQLTELIEVTPLHSTDTSIIIIFATIIANHDDQATYSTDTSKLQEILETCTDQLHPTHFLVINMIMMLTLVSIWFDLHY